MIETSSGTLDLTDITSRLSQAQVIEKWRLAAPPVAVWEQVASVTGVNAELMPVVRVTFPRAARGLTATGSIPSGRYFVVCCCCSACCLSTSTRSRSPASYPGVAFSNRRPRFCTAAGSTSACSTPRAMGPESAIASISSAGCLVSGVALVPVVRAIFRHRHAQLRRHFGTRQHNLGPL